MCVLNSYSPNSEACRFYNLIRAAAESARQIPDNDVANLL